MDSSLIMDSPLLNISKIPDGDIFLDWWLSKNPDILMSCQCYDCFDNFFKEIEKHISFCKKSDNKNLITDKWITDLYYIFLQVWNKHYKC